MTLIRKLKSILNIKIKETDIENPNSLIAMNVKILKNNAVDCRCGAIAIPIEITGERYKCIRCDQQLTSMSYNLGPRDVTYGTLSVSLKASNQLVDIAYYDDSVHFLKNEDKRRR